MTVNNSLSIYAFTGGMSLDTFSGISQAKIDIVAVHKLESWQKGEKCINL